MPDADDPTLLLPSLWDERATAGMPAQQILLYRSNLLGSDKRITNFGGGNTSSKLPMTDPLTGAKVTVLWVKGSGGDLGSMKLDGFATLYQDRLTSLIARYAGPDSEDQMVGLYAHCAFNLNARPASIDTPLHGLVPYPHVDHVHPDAVIAIAAAEDGEAMAREIYGEDIGWLPWRRPGFELGLWLRDFAQSRPDAKGVILAAHGLFTWADDQRACYETTIATINKAIAYFAGRAHGRPAFGGQHVAALDERARREAAATLMPTLRGLVSGTRRMVGHFDDQKAVLEFVGSVALEEMAALGTSCPDHFLRTKIRPAVHPFNPARETLDDLRPRLPAVIDAYRKDYAAYYNRCRYPNSPAMRDANPVVHLIPGIGMITFATDKATARIAAEFYVNAINVMRAATAASTYRGLAEQEAFEIEYWLLEEAKLQRISPPKSLAGRVALITGGAGGIGSAAAERLLREGACVVLLDIDQAGLDAAAAAFAARFGTDNVRAAAADVTKEDAVRAAFATAALAYGGIDILVSNAGISSAAPIQDTPLAVWDRNIAILATGYFLVSREAFRLMLEQDMGGAIVFVASKNGLAASPNAAAYCTAKAAEIHLARCLALEGAPKRIRANVVNPDAVLAGSRIWQGEWREQRAAAYRIAPDELEEHYRKRSLLQLSVLPEDVAEAIYFLASDMSAKSTGNIVNVDAGNAQSFTR